MLHPCTKKVMFLLGEYTWILPQPDLLQGLGLTCTDACLVFFDVFGRVFSTYVDISNPPTC